jgi:hypothetical protein
VDNAGMIGKIVCGGVVSSGLADMSFAFQSVRRMH